MEQVERLLFTCQLNKIIYRFLVFLSWRYVSSQILGAVCFVLETRRLTFVSEPLSICFEVYDPLPVVTWLSDNRKYVFPESEEPKKGLCRTKSVSKSLVDVQVLILRGIVSHIPADFGAIELSQSWFSKLVCSKGSVSVDVIVQGVPAFLCNL